MTEELWLDAATTDLRTVLEAAARGVVTVLTEGGKPLARVLPEPCERDWKSLGVVLQELEQIRARTVLGPEPNADLFREEQD